MPELAECALFAKDINSRVAGLPLTSVRRGIDTKWSKKIIPDDIVQYLIGGELDLQYERYNFSSWGKSIYITRQSFSHSEIEVKLGMTGGFRVSKVGLAFDGSIDLSETSMKEMDPRHILLDLNFSGTHIFYIDYRRFGQWKKAFPGVRATLGLGGYNKQSLKISDGANWDFEFKAVCRKPRISWLLDTGVRSGVGNYMANEALGRLGLNPFEPFQSPREAKEALLECARIAEESYQVGGNSFNGGYYRLDGTAGDYQSQCKFYKNQDLNRTAFRGRPVYSKFTPKE